MADPATVKSKILIVDEKPEDASAVEEALRGIGYANIQKVDKAGMLPTLEKEYRPDIIIISPKVSDADVVEVVQQLKKNMPADSYLPVLTMLGPDIPEDTRERVLSQVAKDFLTQPVQRFEVATRVAAYLEARALYLKMHKKRQLLEEQLSSRNRELENAQFELLERLAMVVEHRDDDTGRHVQRVATISKLVAMDLGLPENEVMLVERAAPLHDVGKISIPDSILHKPGKMTPEEFEIMKTHTTMGAKLLSGGRSILMMMTEQIALGHHEKWNGTGYPLSLKEWAIPMAARIMAIADVFDALTHPRPYKEAWPIEDVIAELNRLKGQHFDPTVVEAMMRVLEEHDLGELT